MKGLGLPPRLIGILMDREVPVDDDEVVGVWEEDEDVLFDP